MFRLLSKSPDLRGAGAYQNELRVSPKDQQLGVDSTLSIPSKSCSVNEHLSVAILDIRAEPAYDQLSFGRKNVKLGRYSLISDLTHIHAGLVGASQYK